MSDKAESGGVRVVRCAGALVRWMLARLTCVTCRYLAPVWAWAAGADAHRVQSLGRQQLRQAVQMWARTPSRRVKTPRHPPSRWQLICR